MPELPDNTPDTVWCDVCQEHVPPDYAHAHTEQASPEAMERLHQILDHRDDDDSGT